MDGRLKSRAGAADGQPDVDRHDVHRPAAIYRTYTLPHLAASAVRRALDGVCALPRLADPAFCRINDDVPTRRARARLHSHTELHLPRRDALPRAAVPQDARSARRGASRARALRRSRGRLFLLCRVLVLLLLPRGLVRARRPVVLAAARTAVAERGRADRLAVLPIAARATTSGLVTTVAAGGHDPRGRSGPGPGHHHPAPRRRQHRRGAAPAVSLWTVVAPAPALNKDAPTADRRGHVAVPKTVGIIVGVDGRRRLLGSLVDSQVVV